VPAPLPEHINTTTPSGRRKKLENTKRRETGLNLRLCDLHVPAATRRWQHMRKTAIALHVLATA
jgi:hypothetical protein